LLVDELARLFAFFDLRVVLGDEVRQVKCAGQAGRAAAYEDDARFHGVSLDHGMWVAFSTPNAREENLSGGRLCLRIHATSKV
jgi:hypothetical protein